MKRFWAALAFFCLLITGCSSPEAITVWKEKSAKRDFHKIMVVGLVKDSLSLRRNMEDFFVAELNKLGYKALSSFEEFGTEGLAHMEKEATYLQLCSEGVDAVLTVALLKNSREHSTISPRAKFSSGVYYYNRVMNYQSLQANPSEGTTSNGKKYYWESILFDLQTLSPSYTVQTNTFPAGSIDLLQAKHGQLILSSLISNQIIKPQMPAQTDSLRAF